MSPSLENLRMASRPCSFSCNAAMMLYASLDTGEPISPPPPIFCSCVPPSFCCVAISVPPLERRWAWGGGGHPARSARNVYGVHAVVGRRGAGDVRRSGGAHDGVVGTRL